MHLPRNSSSRPFFPGTVRWRFLALLGGLCLAFLGVLTALRLVEARQLSAQHGQLRAEATREINRWLAIADRPMQELLLDLAPLPQTRAMLVRPDPEWLQANLETALADRQFDAVWLLRANGQLAHVAARDPATSLPPSPDVRALARAERDGRRVEFFALQQNALWQFQAAPLTNDGVVAGWLVVGRRWSEAWLAHLAAMTDASTRLEETGATRPGRAEKLSVRRPLADLEGRVVRELVVEREWPTEIAAAVPTWQIVSLFVAFGALLLAALALAVRRWVLAPLGLIGESLRTRDPAAIAPLVTRDDEFTAVAQLVESAHVDRKALQLEIAERQRTEVALRESQENLRNSIELRARLARDLHDHVIQSIYAAGLGLESARTTMSADPFGAEGRIKHCMASLNETIRTVRAYISDLEPDPPQERQQFTAAVRALTLTMHELWPVDFALELDDAAAARLTSVAEVHALQIVRESVSNALRHGRATLIVIRLRSLPDGGAQLEVQDNGRGFDPVQKMGTGRGLVNLTTRAREMGATVRIDSAAERGTTVRLIFPGPGAAP